MPLMMAIQIGSPPIGFVTGRGLVANVKARLPRWMLLSVVLLPLAANALNNATGVAAMAVAPLFGDPPAHDVDTR